MRKRIGIFLGLLLLAAAFLSGCGNTPGSGPSAAQQSASAVDGSASSMPEPGHLDLRMLNVGQGDAILIQTSEQTVLIDTSDVDEREKLRSELQKAGVRKIDKVILTHPHADHIGGMELLLKEFQVGEVYDNGMLSTSKLYIGYRKALKAKGIPCHALKAGDVLDFGDHISFQVFAPSAEQVQKGSKKGYKHDPNNESVTGKLVFGTFSMMFTGDAETKEEESMLARYQKDLKASVLKAGHHGSKTSSSNVFLRAVQPEAVLISCGAGNDYGHPHKEAMKRFRALKLKIFETDKNGTIRITSDGQSYQIQPEEGGAQ